MSDAQEQVEKMAGFLLKDMPDVYTNNIRVTANVFEIAFDFLLDTRMLDGTTATQSIVRVRMSPQQAMAFKLLLDKNLERYGKQFQEIFLPDELVKSLSDTESKEHDETT